MKVGIIGGGVMGEAILSAALDRGVFEKSNVTVCDVVAVRCEELEAQYGVATVNDAAVAMAGADLVILSVKPQDLGSVEGALAPGALLLSIMAGVRVATLAEAFRHERIVRVMPNTPVAVKAGMSAWTATTAVTEAQRDLTRGLLQAIGRELYVDTETKIDMATAVSGSGPGYVFLFIEAMIDAAVNVGFPRAQAQELAIQTVLGSALYASESPLSAGELRARVTSPGGTTAAGLLELERHALRASVADAIQAAFDRAQELGGSG